MKITGAKFSEESISKFLMPLVERLSVDNYDYVQHLKASVKLRPRDSLDIVILLDDYKDKIEHLYSGLDYRMGLNSKIPTFFRSPDRKAFLFPGGVNILFVTLGEFQMMGHKWNVLAGVAEKHLMGLLTSKTVDWPRENEFLTIDKNTYFDEYKEVAELFGKQLTAKKLEE